MAKLKKDDFIELSYTGRTKEDSEVFDTTDEAVAKEAGIYDPSSRYGPAIICIGEGHVIKGLDDELVGKETGKEYTVEVQPEDGFGKRLARNIQLINTSLFKKQNIAPVPGLQVNVDNQMGIIKTVTGGRTMVDFNHPLAGKVLVYDIRVGELVTDDLKKAKSLVSMMLGDTDVSLEDGKLKVGLKMKLPKEILEKITEKIKKLVPGIKEIEYPTAT